MFLLSAFSVPMSYTTLNTDPQDFPSFLQVHPHFGHICVHVVVVISPEVRCTCFPGCAEARENGLQASISTPLPLGKVGTYQQIKVANHSPSSVNILQSPKGFETCLIVKFGSFILSP